MTMARMRTSPLQAWLLAAGALAGADLQDGWQFAPGDAHLYQYDVHQDTVFESAGDHLTYSTSLGWRLALARTAAPAPAGRITLGVTILRITATLDGPASHHAIDTDAPSSSAAHDPLFGHLFDLNFAGFTLILDPRTGVVDSVSGGEAVAQKISQHEPSAFSSDDPSPLAAAARAAYSSSALAALYSQLLALPTSSPQTVPLGPPLSGSLIRSWNGNHYTLALPPGLDQVAVTLGSGPLAVTGTLGELKGGGSANPRGGVPGTADGHLEFTLTLRALTQPVVEHQVLTWQLHEVPLKP
jgi:hypothetical protein